MIFAEIQLSGIPLCAVSFKLRRGDVLTLIPIRQFGVFDSALFACDCSRCYRVFNIRDAEGRKSDGRNEMELFV